jgi:hypothetical protein
VQNHLGDSERQRGQRGQGGAALPHHKSDDGEVRQLLASGEGGLRLPREATFQQSGVVEAEAARHPHNGGSKGKRRGSSHVSDRRISGAWHNEGKAERRGQHGGTVAALLPAALGPLPLLAALITSP